MVLWWTICRAALSLDLAKREIMVMYSRYRDIWRFRFWRLLRELRDVHGWLTLTRQTSGRIYNEILEKSQGIQCFKAFCKGL